MNALLLLVNWITLGVAFAVFGASVALLRYNIVRYSQLQTNNKLQGVSSVRVKMMTNPSSATASGSGRENYRIKTRQTGLSGPLQVEIAVYDIMDGSVTFTMDERTAINFYTAISDAISLAHIEINSQYGKRNEKTT